MSIRAPKPAEKTSYRRLFWLLALLNLLAAIWVVWDDAETRRPWKRVQSQWNDLLEAHGQRPEPIAIRQVMNPALGVVDRCQTCHLGIDRPGFDGADIPRVFRTHPHRKQLLGTRHPIDRFGCTTCHQGQGAQTKGIGGATFDHGRNDRYWDTPMLSTVFAQSSCATCHSKEHTLEGAETFVRGRELFVQLRCYGCHETPLAQVESGFDPAPALDHIVAKSSAAFVTAWLRDPSAFRPHTVMPSFWPKPTDARGRPLAENDPAYAHWQRARDREIASIVAFLSTIQPRSPLPEQPVPAVDDPALVERGAALFDKVGCRGCHAMGSGTGPDGKAGWQSTFGPDLSRVGEKASPRWLAAWLANPSAVWSGTRMPRLRLDQEMRNALVAFLASRRAQKAAPAGDAWPAPDPRLVAAGRDAVRRYGCYSCHSIPGIDATAKAGPDLTDFGDKTSDRLAWGDAKVDCDAPALECWTIAKLEQPRHLAGKNLALTMPSSRLDADQARALAVFVLANRLRTIPADYLPTLPAKQRALDRGEALLAQLNCRGCHEIGRTEKKVLDEDGEVDETIYIPQGGQIRRYYQQIWDAPPPLTFAGRKFQYPWLYDFLSAPGPVRPWLLIRMPTFRLSDPQIDTLIRYFAARNDQPYPFQSTQPPPLGADRGPAEQMFRSFQCYRCHEISGATGLQAGELAPDLTNVHRRLKADWVRAWLRDPQTLQPGTKMPTYFPLEDDDEPNGPRSTPCPDCFGGDVTRQIDALTGAVFELGRAINLAPAPASQ